uniref:Rep_fac-A_C domain-containing protein n=1 Tax=Heterorhabditis bacteriophora TaxID=37862 RepID=A0A1I7XQ68_HETBA
MTEVPALYDWYTRERPVVETKTISTGSGGAGGEAFSRDLRFIGTAVALQLGNEAAMLNGRYMNIKAMVTATKSDQSLYQACVNEGCQKKVVQLDMHYRCEKCNSTSDSFKWNYMVQMELTDMTGSFWVTMFSAAAAKLFGIEAQQLGELKQNDKEAYEAVFENARFKYYNWRIRAKAETYNEETRVRYQVIGCDPVPYDKYINHLDLTLQKLEQLQC